MTRRRFTHINEHFDCTFCGARVLPLAKGCRNHCPECLSSVHVDILPGDRANPCKGQLKAVAYDISGKKGIVLEFECQLCGEKTKNRAAEDDPQQPDCYEKILLLKPKR